MNPTDQTLQWEADERAVRASLAPPGVALAGVSSASVHRPVIARLHGPSVRKTDGPWRSISMPLKSTGCLSVTPGHTLVIPMRHVRSFFDTTFEERNSLFELLEMAKKQIELEFTPAGYNIGINDGAAAGQTVGHLHIHLIPRYPGDVVDPRGGVRWVIPERADYWTDRR